MSAVVARVDRQEVDIAPVNEASSIMQAILRAAQDNTVDLDRVKELMAMRKELAAEQDRRAFNVAMAQAQAEMRAVVTDKRNTQTKSNYASYAALDNVVRPIYTRHGFSVTYNSEPADTTDMIRVVAYVENCGFERRYSVDMPCDGKGAKGGDVMTKTHAMKSAVTYGKATLLPMIFNIAVTDRSDDDGNAAGSRHEPLISEDQAIELRDIILSLGRTEKQFCEYAEVSALSAIHASKFQDAKKFLSTLKQKGQK